MDVVIRAVNERFLDEVAFPIFEQGSTDSAGAIERLAHVIDDPETRLQAEALLDRRAEGGWSEVDADRFQEVVYRLLFCEWRRTPTGWHVVERDDAYANTLDQAVHFAMMLTDPAYPYWDPAEAQRQRDVLVTPPYMERGLPAFVSGLWDPAPGFAPGEVLTTRGTNIHRPREGYSLADWAYRDRHTVAEWSADLPRTLRSLLHREIERLRPIDVPEASEVIEYWLGTTPHPPQLVVAFSGLGASSTQWVREIADLAAQIRRAAAREQALTSIITVGTQPLL